MKGCKVELHRALSFGVLSVLCIGISVAAHADTTANYDRAIADGGSQSLF